MPRSAFRRRSQKVQHDGHAIALGKLGPYSSPSNSFIKRLCWPAPDYGELKTEIKVEIATRPILPGSAVRSGVDDARGSGILAFSFRSGASHVSGLCRPSGDGVRAVPGPVKLPPRRREQMDEEPDPESPIGIWRCLLCGMPQAVYEPQNGLVLHCRDFCGWDEAESLRKLGADDVGPRHFDAP